MLLLHRCFFGCCSFPEGYIEDRFTELNQFYLADTNHTEPNPISVNLVQLFAGSRVLCNERFCIYLVLSICVLRSGGAKLCFSRQKEYMVQHSVGAKKKHSGKTQKKVRREATKQGTFRHLGQYAERPCKS